MQTELIHVAPTILAYMGLPIPADMDGQFIEEIFDEEWKRTHEVVRSGASSEEGKGWGRGQDVFDSSDEDVLVERLRGLGYVD